MDISVLTKLALAVSCRNEVRGMNDFHISTTDILWRNSNASALPIDGTRTIVFLGCLSIYACICTCIWGCDFSRNLILWGNFCKFIMAGFHTRLIRECGCLIN